MIFVDGDACPVKEEVYRVAKRYKLSVTLVANAPMRVPTADWLTLVVVKGHYEAADDWIAEQVAGDDIVITADIPLASRCLEKQAHVLDSRGGKFSAESIGSALASRELMTQLRDLGTITGGPPPFSKQDRSQFLQTLDQTIQKLRRKK
ncbi:YaiI/YqxD family protein [Symmachiella dynata]|uniref:YaiI/YqxD family protein n=1 Tax=Symmachiella dynata TaxID=2527995 RepID=UPI001188174E|nr:YaiI/YqxD family protein [Symmachiella dynata]QDT49279.1 hypothetical protein Pan258_33260 [Symmachiella dynata]